MPANHNNTPNSENVFVEDSLGFLNDSTHIKLDSNVEPTLGSNNLVSRTTELWQNANDKMKKLLENRKDLSSSVLDEITPPGNRLPHKSFSSNNQLNYNNDNNYSAVSDVRMGFLNTSYFYNEACDHTPINGNRPEHSNIAQLRQSPPNMSPSSTPSKTVTISHNNSSTAKTPQKNNFEAFYDTNMLHPPNDSLYHDSWRYSYPMGSNNTSYKPTITPPNSIDEHVSMLGESFSKMSTGLNMTTDDMNYYGNFCAKDNLPNSLPVVGVGVSKLPHPSFAPPITANSNRQQLSYGSHNNDISAEISSKFHDNRTSAHDLQHYPHSNDLYHVRPMYEFHRTENSNTNTSAGCVAPNSNKPYVSWMGKLTVKSHPDPIYSNKVFLGGLPWDITEQGLYVVFKQFGPCTFEWPGKDNRSTRHPPKGYVYLIFENERSVKTLLQYCHHDEQRTQFYFKLKTHTTNNEKSIQIIPWNLANSSYLKCSSERLDITKTVFVGGLHGKITAENLAVVFEELFGHVIYAGIDTDKNKYPIGSGRVTFDNFESYRNAIQASFVQINGKNFCKKVQIDPYLEDSICQLCTQKNGPFFCKDFDCLQYFCKDCWIVKHCNPENPQMINHRPINRQNSSDIFEILNSIQYYSQMSTSKVTANGSQPSLSAKPNICIQNCLSNNRCSDGTEKSSCDLNKTSSNPPDGSTST